MSSIAKMTKPLPMELKSSNAKKYTGDDYAIFFNVFKNYSGFNNNKDIDLTELLIKFNKEMQSNKKMQSYYIMYEEIYDVFKTSIIMENEQDNENKIKKENYKKIFLAYLNNCFSVYDEIKNNSDSNNEKEKFLERFDHHIRYINSVYTVYINKEADDSVRGGKKSSEYIDYKFQNKIYRRKIRYEGKKKYIILNKQKVFIKNKK
jgi:hypothetical protein